MRRRLPRVDDVMSTVPGRGNGLTAASYIALTDLDPQLADAVLDTLRVENIAAYAAPATDRPLAELAAERKLRPLDRVFVDRAASARARVILDAELPRLQAEHEAAHPPPEPSTVDDEVWAGIVAALSRSTADAAPTWPPSEDLADDQDTDRPDRTETGGDDPLARGRILRPAAPASGPAAAERPGSEPPDRGDDHFVPPPPPPLPRLDPISKAAWSAVLGAPLALILAVVLGADLTGLTGLLLVGAFVGGFVTLVARMKDGGDDDSGWHDGAVV
jgi:hypothetical protein